jgi:hypothetical protein
MMTLLLFGLFSVSNVLSKDNNVFGSYQIATYSTTYENITTHEGDLIIDGYKTVVIENCTYIQSGEVYVREHGKLTVKNAQFQVNQTRPWQHEVRVSDFGKLELQKTVITSKYPIEMNFLDNSRVYVANVTLIEKLAWIRFCDFTELDMYNSSFVGFQMFGNSRALVMNSTLDGIEFMWSASNVTIFNSNLHSVGLRFERGSTIHLNGLKPGFFTQLRLGDVVTGARFQLILDRTFVNNWRAYAYFDSETIISNSTIDLSISFKDLQSVIDEVSPGFYSDKRVGAIVLRDTFLMGITLHDVLDSNVTVINSTVSLIPFGKSLLYMNSSVVMGLFTHGFFGSLQFEKTSWRGGITVYYSNFFIIGNVSFEDFGGIDWILSNITRNYGIIVKNAYGRFVSNATLTLTSKDGMSIWNGTTDAQGKANFNLTFTDSNYTDRLRLEAVKGNYSAFVNISFLSDTPVILTLRYFADLNGDGVINIIDVAIVARAFETKPGDKNWNSNADLNNDGIINIVDVATVAREFGKTI